MASHHDIRYYPRPLESPPKLCTRSARRSRYVNLTISLPPKKQGQLPLKSLRSSCRSPCAQHSQLNVNRPFCLPRGTFEVFNSQDDMRNRLQSQACGGCIACRPSGLVGLFRRLHSSVGFFEGVPGWGGRHSVRAVLQSCGVKGNALNPMPKGSGPSPRQVAVVLSSHALKNPTQGPQTLTPSHCA